MDQLSLILKCFARLSEQQMAWLHAHPVCAVGAGGALPWQRGRARRGRGYVGKEGASCTDPSKPAASPAPAATSCPWRSYSRMALPRPSEVEPLRRRFPHFSPQLMEVLEACLQVCHSAWWGAGSRRTLRFAARRQMQHAIPRLPARRWTRRAAPPRHSFWPCPTLPTANPG